MDKPKVVRWVSYEETESMKESVGGLGGDPVRRTWRGYLASWVPEVHPYLEAIRAEILKDRNKNNGSWHQHCGCPVFSDGTCAAFSMRAWGDLQSAIWNTAEKRGRARRYGYMDFYC